MLRWPTVRPSVASRGNLDTRRTAHMRNVAIRRSKLQRRTRSPRIPRVILETYLIYDLVRAELREAETRREDSTLRTNRIVKVKYNLLRKPKTVFPVLSKRIDLFGKK